MRISDWSSDVCASDLQQGRGDRDEDVVETGDEAELFFIDGRGRPSRIRMRPERRRLIRGKEAHGDGGFKIFVGIHDQLPILHSPPCQGRGSRGGCPRPRSEEHTSELQSLMRISYAVFCLKK